MAAACILAGIKIYHNSCTKGNMLYNAEDGSAVNCRDILFSDGVNFEKHFLLYNLDIPAEKLRTFRITLNTTEKIDPNKELRNPVFGFWHLTGTDSRTKKVRSYLFQEPLGSKKNTYVIIMEFVPGFQGIVKSLMIGPFSKIEAQITALEIVNDPVLDIVLALKRSKTLNILLPALLFGFSAIFLLTWLIFDDRKFLFGRFMASNKDLIQRMLSVLFFVYIMFSLFFPFQILFIKHRYFNFMPVDFSTALILPFFFLSLPFLRQEKTKSRLIFYITLLFWGLHAFVSIANISQAKSLDTFFDIALNNIIAPVLIFFVAYALFSRNDAILMLKALLASIVFLSSLSLFETLLGYNILFNNVINLFYRDFVSFQTGDRISSSMIHPLIFASILLLFIPRLLKLMEFSKKLPYRALVLASLVVVLSALLLTASRGAIVITFLYILYMLIRIIIKTGKPYKIIIVILLCTAGIIALTPDKMIISLKKRFIPATSLTSTQAFVHRKHAVRAAFKTAYSNPLFGEGLGNVGKTIQKSSKSYLAGEKISSAWYTTDNYYLYIIIERGIIGFITLFFPIIYILYLSRPGKKAPFEAQAIGLSSGLTVFLIHLLVVDGLNWIVLYTSFYFLLALSLKFMTESWDEQ